MQNQVTPAETLARCIGCALLCTGAWCAELALAGMGMMEG